MMVLMLIMTIVARMAMVMEIAMPMVNVMAHAILLKAVQTLW